MVVNVCCKFVSQKINKIRWRPVPTDISSKPSIFVCGGWQNAFNTSITVWKSPETTGSADFEGMVDNGELGSERIVDPKLLYEIPHDGDVTDMKYINKDLFAVSSSTGRVALYKHNPHLEPKLQISWDKSHGFRNDIASCTALDCFGDSIVSVGEDGRLIHYNINQQKCLQSFEADSCTIKTVTFLKHNEVITGNVQGLNVWDLRKPGEPAKILLMSRDQSGIISLNQHPTLPNVLACGTEDGSLVIWDLKKEKYPQTLMTAHNGPIFELKFHPLSPNHLFSCSMDGSIWHWDSSGLEQNLLKHSTSMKPNTDGDSISPWLQWNASKQKLNICSLIPSSNKPINSLDILQDVLLCGSDNEAFYIISELSC